MNRFLVCLDASPETSAVLARATALARATGAKLVLLRVVGLPSGHEMPKAALAMSQEEALELWRRDAERDLEALRTTLPDGLVELSIAKVGAPWSTITQIAKELRVDLIVMGAHGHHAIDRFLGTTSSKVVNHADTSVLVVR